MKKVKVLFLMAIFASLSSDLFGGEELKKLCDEGDAISCVKYGQFLRTPVKEKQTDIHIGSEQPAISQEVLLKAFNYSILGCMSGIAQGCLDAREQNSDRYYKVLSIYIDGITEKCERGDQISCSGLDNGWLQQFDLGTLSPIAECQNSNYTDNQMCGVAASAIRNDIRYVENPSELPFKTRTMRNNALRNAFELSMYECLTYLGGDHCYLPKQLVKEHPELNLDYAGRVNKHIDELVQQCEKGLSGHACSKIVPLYMSKNDNDMALKFAIKGSTLKDATSMYFQAVLLSQKTGFDLSKVMSLAKKACVAGVGDSCMLYGLNIISNPTKKNFETAISYLDRGCKLGSSKACSENLGIMVAYRMRFPR